MKYEHRYLFVEILEGVLLVMLGVATMLRTEQVLDSLTLIFGILAVITGLADVMFYIRLERAHGLPPCGITGFQHTQHNAWMCPYSTP